MSDNEGENQFINVEPLATPELATEEHIVEFEDVEQQEEYVEESEEAVQESEEAVQESEEPVQESEEPVQASEEAVQEYEEAVQESEEAVQESEEAVQESEEAVQESEEYVEESEEAVQESEEYVEESEEPVQESEEYVEESEEPLQDPVKQNIFMHIIESIPPVQPTEPIPKIVFIVPYRDRQQQQEFFAKQMKFILEDIPSDDYKIYYIHQCDTREFNRGALKNIGFLVVKEKYPNDYQNITLVMNDVDTMPYTKNFLNYETTKGNVKHFYGFVYTLGGIVSINAGDFEKVNGFPNMWAWGYEDNLLQHRVEMNDIKIDRSQFYKFMDKNIIQMKDDIYRTINRAEFELFRHITKEGINSISNVTYTIDEETGFVNVTQFNTGREEIVATKSIYDLRKGNRPFKHVTDKPKPRVFGNMLVGSRTRKSSMNLDSFNTQIQNPVVLSPQNIVAPQIMQIQPNRAFQNKNHFFNMKI
jgi:hypothetical protein